jgi:hypothetical protein
MNTLIELYGVRLDRAIELKDRNRPFILTELDGQLWDQISNDIGPKQAGRMFREAVEAGEFPGVTYHAIRPAGRANEYIRL